MLTVAELSIRRTVREPGTPLKLLTGTKRRLWLDSTSNGAASVGLPTATQLAPLKYSQTPCCAVAAFATMAMPASVLALEPPDVSVLSLKRAANRLPTVLPATEPETVSSSTAKSVDEPVATGASLTAVTLVFKLTALALLL